DKRELPGQSHKLVSELNIIKPNLRDGYGIRFENSHRPESGLSEISIKIDKETFENAINYKNRNGDKNSNNSANNVSDNNNSEDQADSSEKKNTSDSYRELSASDQCSQPEEAPAEARDNNSIKNKFGLGAEAETWDNESRDEAEDDNGGD
ncbi:MAG: hypothetical protein WA631_12140, partial [Nitrososphaeraceae archaeon]